VDSAEGADVDDAAMGGFEVRVGGLGDEERAAGVGLEHGVPLGDGDGFEDGGFKDSGVVDQDIQPAEGGDDGGDGLADALGGADIALEGSGLDSEGVELGDGAGGFGLGVAVGDGDICAIFGEGEGQHLADPLSRAGDQRDVIL